MMKTILIEYWRSTNLTINLGDYITEILLERMGYQVENYSDAKRNHTLGRYDACLFAAGSIIDAYWFDKVAMPKVIWGSGWWGDSRFPIDRISEATVTAVRGPLTRSLLDLPPEMPLGDPGLLLPHFFPMTRESNAGVVYIPHFESRDKLKRDTLMTLGATNYLDVCFTRESFKESIQRIVDADFVLTSSLHGAIIAQAYGTPWSLCCPESSVHNHPLKWDDWFQYLGTESHVSSDIFNAMEWWNEKGGRTVTPACHDLLDHFPHDLAK